MSVSATTKLTALLALGGLSGFCLASRILSRGGDPYRMVLRGTLIGLPAFALVMSAAPLQTPTLFLIGNFLIGFGAALFGHGTLTATMNRAPDNQAGACPGCLGRCTSNCGRRGHCLEWRHTRCRQCPTQCCQQQLGTRRWLRGRLWYRDYAAVDYHRGNLATVATSHERQGKRGPQSSGNSELAPR